MTNQRIKKRILRHLNNCEGCMRTVTQHMVLNGEIQIEGGKLVCKGKGKA
jgi:hypothetical protein